MFINIVCWKNWDNSSYLFWLKRDYNSSYLHASASTRNNCITIKIYKSSNGLTVTNPSLIAEEITKDFQLRFVINSDCYFDIDLDVELITPIISHQEI